MHLHRRGFSLLELSIVVAISGLMLSFVLNASQGKSSAANGECTISTQLQMNYIKAQIDAFARKNDRLPLPSPRNAGVEDLTYGRESSGANIDEPGVAGTTKVSFGALPFQALGLPASYAGDCWGNKFTYVVTTALTTSAASGGYMDSTMKGNITLKRTTAINAQTEIAYAVISHGVDELGAVELNYSAANGTNTPPYAGHKWCSGSTDLKYLNCLATSATIAEGVPNDGKDAAANYFDDLVIAGGKPQVLSSALSNAYCWGTNTYGQLGDGTTTARPQATPVQLPSGAYMFSSISNGGESTCALSESGKPYCWGRNNAGQIGNGTSGASTSSSVPKAVTLPGSVTHFTTISSGADHNCGMASDGKAYCWGYNAKGQFGVGGYGSYNSPIVIATALGVTNIVKVAAGDSLTCVITNTGALYCMGENTHGQVGVGTCCTSGSGAVAVPGDPGVTGYTSISLANNHVCALVNTGDAYCWGQDTYEQLGNGASGASYTPVPVTMPPGVKFTQIATGGTSSCALGDDNKAYCWGGSYYSGGKNQGEIGDGNWLNRDVPTEVSLPLGVTFTSINGQRDNQGMCAVGSNLKLYCWGNNAANQLSDGTTTDRNVPTEVTAATGTLYLSSHNRGRCALAPLPPASWGANSTGGNTAVVGDDTTTNRPTPVYVKLPSTISYFKSIDFSCGISNADQVYCWGTNSVTRTGDGTGAAGNKKSPTNAATLPSGVTSWQSVASSYYGACAIGNDNKLYCWGTNWSFVGGVSGDSPTAATTINTGCANNVAEVNLWSYGGTARCASGVVYEWASNTPSVLQMPNVTIPGAASSAKMADSGSRGTCILGNDDQIYCKGENGAYSARGDNNTYGTTTTLGPINMTGPTADGVTYWTELSTGDGGSGWAFHCAIANTGRPYCWGHGYDGMVGNGSSANAYEPTGVTMPSGVTSFSKLNVGARIVTAYGNDGNMYYWGLLDDSNTTARTFVPTRLALPTGASAYVSDSFRGMSGRRGLVR